MRSGCYALRGVWAPQVTRCPGKVAVDQFSAGRSVLLVLPLMHSQHVKTAVLCFDKVRCNIMIVRSYVIDGLPAQ
jgi:hypothetical protein